MKQILLTINCFQITIYFLKLTKINNYFKADLYKVFDNLSKKKRVLFKYLYNYLSSFFHLF